jgi:parallel beta-helix repeat protein
VGGIGGYSYCNTVISNCNICLNYNGIGLFSSNNNTIINCNIYQNNGYGIRLHENNRNNLIYHNNFKNNTVNAQDSLFNAWNSTYPAGGNYWDDYSGIDSYSGPNQDIPGSDGIGDTPYEIAGGNSQDRYPFMHPNGWLDSMPPGSGIFGIVIESYQEPGYGRDWVYTGYNPSILSYSYTWTTPNPDPYAGDFLDLCWFNPLGTNSYVIWDMGLPVPGVRVYPTQDHLGWDTIIGMPNTDPDNPNEFEYHEYYVYVSNNPTGPWTLIMETAFWLEGYDTRSEAVADDAVKDYDFGDQNYRYIKIMPKLDYNPFTGAIPPHKADYEIDAVEALDDIPPTTAKTVGDSKYGENDKWVNLSTLIWLNATDDISGVKYTHYEIWWDNDNDGTVDTKVEDVKVYDNDLNDMDPVIGNISVKFKFNEECLHEIRYYSVDRVGNVEEVHNQTHYIDDTPPRSWKTIGEPKYPESGRWVTTKTPITLEAVDKGNCSVGIWRIHWEIHNDTGIIDSGVGDWNTNVTIYFTEECNHTLMWFSEDRLGNREDKHSQYHYVDDTPPITNITVIPILADYPIQPVPPIVTSYTVVLSAEDHGECAVGVANISFRVQNKFGQWSPWQMGESPVQLELPGNVIGIEYYSSDLLGNTEEIQYTELQSYHP